MKSKLTPIKLYKGGSIYNSLKWMFKYNYRYRDDIRNRGGSRGYRIII